MLSALTVRVVGDERKTPPSAALWTAAEPSAVAALHSPFCAGLAAGTLPREAFGAYVAQDHFFLAAFGDAYAKAAARLPLAIREKHGPAVAALVAGVEAERAGHAASANQWGITDIGAVAPLAATREYCALLGAAAATGVGGSGGVGGGGSVEGGGGRGDSSADGLRRGRPGVRELLPGGGRGEASSSSVIRRLSAGRAPSASCSGCSRSKKSSSASINGASFKS